MLPVRFESPLLLLLVPVVGAALVLLRQRRGGVCALAAVCCLTVALARPSWRVQGQQLARIYALDISGSIRLAPEAILPVVRNSMAQMEAGDRTGLVVFGRSGTVAVPLMHVGRLPGALPMPAAPPRPDGTALAGAIRLAAAQFQDADSSRQIVLITDGRGTAGDAAAEAALAAAHGARLFVVPAGAEGVSDARVVRVVAPSHVRVGQPYALAAELSSTAPLEVTAVLLRDGSPLGAPRRVLLEAGAARRIAFRDVLSQPGSHSYTVRLDVLDDVVENNAAGAVVRVEGELQVAYLSTASEPRALEALLKSADGLDVSRMDPRATDAAAAAIAVADCVIVDDVPARDLSSAAQRAIRGWVRDRAGGLVIVGGRHSYGPGGYAGSPLEEALPVACKRPDLVVVVALDKSGSMAEVVRGRAKMAYAREAVLAMGRALRGKDRFALLAFDAEARPVVPVGPVPQQKPLEDSLARIEPQGSTALDAALWKALELATQASAEVRCVVAVTDGQTEKLDVERLKQEYAKSHVTLAVLMTGSDNAALLRLAALAPGHFYRVADLQKLPTRLLDALRQAVHGRYVIERQTAVRAARSVQLARGVEPGPLLGYTRTTAKPTATVEWMTEGESDPVLARWAFGLGRAVAFTSTVGTRWDEKLWGSGAAALWAQVVRWTARPATSQDFTVETEERQDSVLAIVRAEEAGRFLNGLRLDARLTDPQGEAHVVSFPQTAPGQYEASLPASTAGTYHLAVADGAGGRRLATSFVRSYAREWERLGIDEPAIAEVARQGRGRVLTSLDELTNEETAEARRWEEATWLLVLAGLLLFVAEVCVGVARSRRVRV
ncbi:VWA domain-containing protein [bacterium]|nr:VWA domain-containing protein [bacterium]